MPHKLVDRREGCACASARDGAVLVIGGLSDDREVLTAELRQPLLEGIEPEPEPEPQLGQAQESPQPQPLHKPLTYTSSVWIGAAETLLAGGWDNRSLESVSRCTVLNSSGRWVEVAPLPRARSGHGAALVQIAAKYLAR